MLCQCLLLLIKKMVTLLTLLNSMLHVHFSILVHMYLNNTLKSGHLITSDNSGAEIGEMGLFFWLRLYVCTMLFISFRKHFEKPGGLISILACFYQKCTIQSYQTNRWLWLTQTFISQTFLKAGLKSSS